jgi:hypothetical protein
MAEQRAASGRARARSKDAQTPAGEPAAGSGVGGAGPACPIAFCPVGLAMTLTDQMRPDVVEHLMAAGRELLLAVKAVVDARVEASERSSPLERITIE